MDSPLFSKAAAGRLIIGALLGCMTGIAFGADVSALAPLGSVLLTLIKITAIPYLIFLVTRASLTIAPGYAWKLFGRAVTAVGIVWVLMLGLIELLFWISPALAAVPTAAYALTESIAITRLSPETLVLSMVYNVVPVFLLFGVLLGVALLQEGHSQAARGFLDRTIGAFERILRWLAMILPIGVFAIVAERFGSDSSWLPSFMYPWIAFSYLGSLTLGLVTFPCLLLSVTPLAWRALMRGLWPMLLLALSSGSLLITLPYLISATKHLFRPKASSEELVATELATPLLFNIPMGHLMLIFGVLVSAGYGGIVFDIPAHIKALLLGVLATFGSPLSATLFLTQQLELTAETALLVMAAWPIIRPATALLGASVLMALSLTAIYSTEQRIKINKRLLAATMLLSIAVIMLLGRGLGALMI